MQFDLSSKIEGPIGDVAVIGGINYSPFEYIEPNGVLPQSPPKAIVYNPLNAYSSIWTPTWSCFMGNSITDHIDLHSFYFGCALATKNGVENKTRSCDITVTAYTKTGTTPFAEQNLSFVARSEGLYSNGSQPMVKAKLEGFTGAYSIVFTVDGKPEAPKNKTTALIVDDVDVTIFTTKNFTLPY